MSFIRTLINGEQGLFKPDTLTPMQKLTLRFVVAGLIYYGFVVIEGMLMRLYEIDPLPFVSRKQFFAILTAHPLAGICGALLLIAFLVFFINIVMSVGLQGVLGIFSRSDKDPKVLLPQA